MFSIHFKCQKSNLSVLGMKTRLWKFVVLAHNAPWLHLPSLFEHMILRQKTVFLGRLKSSKSMLRKSIPIGLFVINNNRTIGEPKMSLERVGKAVVLTCFYSRHRKLKVGFRTAVMAGTGANGLVMNFFGFNLSNDACEE